VIFKNSKQKTSLSEMRAPEVNTALFTTTVVVC